MFSMSSIDDIIDEWYDSQLPLGLTDPERRLLEEDEELTAVEIIEREIAKDKGKKESNKVEKF